MKKVLLLTHEYYPFAGGVATYCYNLFKNFPSDQYIILTDCQVVSANSHTVKTKLLAPYLWPHWLKGLYSVLMVVKKHKIEIIFTPNILPLGSIAYFVQKIFGIPYVISLHGLDINLALKNKPALSKKILSNAMTVVCNTAQTASSISAIVSSEKIKIIYPIVDIDPSKIDQVKIDSLKNKYNIIDEKIILTVGRLVARKGHSLLLQALSHLKDLKFKYFIIGRGPEQDALRAQIQAAQLEDRVFLLDDVTTEQLPYFYQLADLFAMPHQVSDTDVEGFGMVFLEAATFHLPIIAGSSGGVREIFTGQGDVIYADDVRQLEIALRTLVTDRHKSQELGQRAYERSEYFKNIASENIKLLENILS